MFEYTKLISKEFLKEGKVSEMFSVHPDCEDRLLNEVQLMESLLDNPQYSDNAQKRLTHLVYKFFEGYVESFDQNPEDFVNYILHINQLSEPTKLISKEFLKEGKVSEMFSGSPHCETHLLNRAKELENLLGDPQYSDNAQQELTELVNEVIHGVCESFRENPEIFIQFLTNFCRRS